MRDFAVIDFETSGLSARSGDRAIEIAVVIFENNTLVSRYQSLINPGISISREITALTKIDNTMLALAPSPDRVMEEVLALVGDRPIIAHNASFDKQFWKFEFERLGISANHQFICTMLLSRRLYPWAEKHTLEQLAKELNLRWDGEAHRALADASITGKLFLKVYQHLVFLYPEKTIDQIFLASYQLLKKDQARSIDKSNRNFHDAKLPPIDHETRHPVSKLSYNCSWCGLLFDFDELDNVGEKFVCMRCRQREKTPNPDIINSENSARREKPLSQIKASDSSESTSVRVITSSEKKAELVPDSSEISIAIPSSNPRKEPLKKPLTFFLAGGALYILIAGANILDRDLSDSPSSTSIIPTMNERSIPNHVYRAMDIRAEAIQQARFEIANENNERWISRIERDLADKKILAVPMTIDSSPHVSQHGIKNDNLQIIDSTKRWFVADNTLYLQILNPTESFISKLTMMVSFSGCAVGKRAILLRIELGEMLEKNARKIYQGALPFDYEVSKFLTGNSGEDCAIIEMVNT